MRSSNFDLSGLLAVAAATPGASVGGMGQSAPGYSGDKSRPHVRPRYVRTTHLTAKTHKQVACVATLTAAEAIRNDVERKAMLKDRAARRAERNA